MNPRSLFYGNDCHLQLILLAGDVRVLSGALHVQRVDGRGNLAVAVDSNVEQSAYQQVAVGAFTNEVKRTNRANTRWKWVAKAKMIHSRCMIDITTGQTHSSNALVVEVTYQATIVLSLGYQVYGSAQFYQFAGTVSGSNSMERKEITCRCRNYWCWAN